MKYLVRALLETSDHLGYCSGGECEYESEVMEHVIEMDDDLDNKKLIKLLPTPEINQEGSGYCDVSKESIDHNLEGHDYRYTILSKTPIVEIKEEYKGSKKTKKVADHIKQISDDYEIKNNQLGQILPLIYMNIENRANAGYRTYIVPKIREILTRDGLDKYEFSIADHEIISETRWCELYGPDIDYNLLDNVLVDKLKEEGFSVISPDMMGNCLVSW